VHAPSPGLDDLRYHEASWTRLAWTVPFISSLLEVLMKDAEARELLDAERARVRQLLDGMVTAAGDDRTAANEPGDMGDSAAPLTTEETDDAVTAALRERFEALDRAETRLKDGTFGRSVRSGVVISDERLKADPTAELTVQEAQQEP
jgi:DnaK suppressor protein